MKKLFTIAFATLVFTAISAQKVEVDGDIIKVDGSDYAILKKVSTGLEHAEYSLQTNDGEEVAIAKVDPAANTQVGNYSASYIHITFMGTTNQASMTYSLSFKKQFAKEVVKCKLFEDGKYNPEGEKKFMLLNPYKPTGDQRTTVIVNNGGNNGQNYEMVDRNRNAMLQVFGGNIQQDFKTIGTVKMSSSASYGKTSYTYKFYLPDGTQVAEATIDGLTAKTANVYTYKDSRRQYVTIRMKATAEDDIATWLVKNYYL